MKTLKKVPIELIRVEFIPEQLGFGKLYYSEEYHTAVHSCLCGCGQKVVTRIKQGEWSLSIKDEKPIMQPSILQRFGCKSHYIITNGVANFV